MADDDAPSANDEQAKKKAQQRALQVAAQEEVNKAANPPGSVESAAIIPSVSAPVTPPAVPSAIPNPLTVGTVFDASIGSSGAPTTANPAVMRPVDMAANRYRDIAATGTPEEKAQALSDYKSAVQYKPPSIADRYDPQKWADFDKAQYDKYTALGPDRWLESPYTIGSGGAKLLMADGTGIPGSGGMRVTPIKEEEAARAMAEKNLRTYQQAIQDAHDLERSTYDTHGRLEKPSESSRAAAAVIRKRATEEGLQSGYLDPKSLAAANIDRAIVAAQAQMNQAREAAQAQQVAQNRLQKDPSTLTGLADLNDLIAKHKQQQIEAENFANRKPLAY